MIKCKKCGESKVTEEFSKNKNRKSGYCSKCKECYKAYRLENKERISSVNRIYRNKNKESIKLKNKQYRINNKDKISKQQKEYRVNNKEKILEINRKYRKYKIETDELYRLRIDITRNIYNSIKNNGYSKESKTFDILGCDIEQFIEHLNDNEYGFEFGNTEIDLDLDHIIPLSSAINEEELIKLNHYTNFQLLPSYYNRYIKSDKIWDKEDFDKWLENNLNNV